MIEALYFYIFAGVLIISSLMAVSARSPMTSVLFLILAFFNTACLFIMLGAEFVGMIMAIVYVGAVAVLFLFIVMMIDIRFKKIRTGIIKHLPLGGFVGLVLLSEFIMIFKKWHISPEALKTVASPMPDVMAVSNTQALGAILYTQYAYPFQIAGLILLVAMIGAITLSLRHNKKFKKQNVSKQINVKVKDIIRIKKVKTGEGI